MSYVARTIFVFSLYLVGLGLILLIVPNSLLGLFAMAQATEVWIRVVGMLALLLGCYYFLAARQEMTPFFQWTVYIRTSVIFFFTLFVLLDFAKPSLILFGVIDLLGAIWTALALRAAKTK